MKLKKLNHPAKWLYLFLLLLPLNLLAQTLENDKSEKDPIVKIVGTEESRVHYTLDLTQLPGFYEKALVVESIFADPKVVIDKTDISVPFLNIYSSLEYDSNEVVKNLENYINKAIEQGSKLSVEEKDSLSAKYNKFR
ncbi:MAG: hypothetical protein IPH84_19635 [Bacteroidales bacterium]|nr:hypothetical protein [Bacteroidales bacterium]